MTDLPAPFDDRPLALAAAFLRRGAGGRSGWVVDAFAGAHLQRAALRGARADGAELARAAAGEGVRVVLVEEDPGLLARLERDLAAAGIPARRAAHPAEAVEGVATLVEAPFAAAAASLAAAIGDAPALVHLAPLSARSLPMPALEAAAALPAGGLLARPPLDDFRRVAGFGGPLADLPPHLRRLLDACSAMLGDPRHGWVADWRAAGEGAADAAIAERLRERIAGRAPGLLARVVLADGVPLLAAFRDDALLAELAAAAAEPPPEPPPAEDPPLDLFPEAIAGDAAPPAPPRPPAKRAGRRTRAAPLDLFDPPPD